MLLHALFFGKTLQLCLLEQKRTAKNTSVIYKEGCCGQGSAGLANLFYLEGPGAVRVPDWACPGGSHRWL